MPTYANPKALKWTLMVTNTAFFFLTLSLLIYTLIDYVGFENDWHPYHSEFNEINSDLIEDGDDQTDEEKPLNSVKQFPSIRSTSVRIIVPLITMAVAIVGIIAANEEKCVLLNINGYLCFLSFFIKYLLIFVSLRMAGLSASWTSLGSVILPLYLAIGLFELVLGMSSCHLSSILKRGGSVTPRIVKLPVT